MPFEREVRLLITLALCAAVLAAAYRFWRRRGRKPYQAASDALLTFFLCQYVAVALPGVLGVLSPWSIGICSILAGAVLWISGSRRPAVESPPSKPVHRYVFAIALGLGIGYAAGYAWIVRWLPVVSNDAITYHFPAAVQWLQEHRLGLYQVWYYNPANTYSPLAGSTFIAWWMGLTGDDLLARYTQFPPLILIGLSSFSLFRRLRVHVIPASLLMFGVMVCDPILSQMTMGKDDLYVVGFFTCAISAMSRPRDRLQSAIAVGLMLACKTTALLMLPLLLLMIGPGTRWRHWLAVSLGALLLAGPWYLRNWIVAGNPVFPVDFLFWKGLCATAPAPQLKTLNGLASVLFRGAYALPLVVALPLLAGWIAGVVRSGGEIVRSGLLRVVFIGPWLGIALFAMTAPFAERRFLLPLIVLLFASFGVGISRAVGNWIVQTAFAAALTATCSVTAFYINDPAAITDFVVIIVLSCLSAIGMVALKRTYWPIVGIIGSTVLVLMTYVFWNSYATKVNTARPQLLAMTYGQPQVDAWMYVQDSVPAQDVVAYANTFYIYPLMGTDQQRRTVHAPTRAGLHTLHDLPRFGGRLNGEELAKAARTAQVSEPDEKTWFANLRAANAKHLIVFLQGGPAAAPELEMAKRNPTMFSETFRNESAVVYRINW